MKHSVSEVTLSNGIKGLLIDVPEAAVVYTEINFRAGEYLLPEEKWETAHLMEHVLLGANKRFPTAQSFQAEIERNGAYSNASTGVYDITYEAESAHFEWERVLELLLVAISEPLFLEEEYEAEAGNVREELVARSNNHFRTLNVALRQQMGLVALPDAKRVEYMKNVTLADVSGHYKKTHTIANARFIIAGNIGKHKARIDALFKEFLTLPKGTKRFELPTEVPKRLPKPILMRRSHVPNMYFYLDTYAHRTFSVRERDALYVCSTLLTETLYSRILGKARARGLVYGMGSGQGFTQNAHNWWIGAQVSVSSAPSLFRLIRDELQAVKDGDLLDEEIAAATTYLIGKHQRSAQTVSSIVSRYSNPYFVESTIDDQAEYEQRITSVTKEDVVRAFTAICSGKTWGLAALGNTHIATIRDLSDILDVLWV